MKIGRVTLCLLFCLTVSPAHAAKWSESTATRDFYNAAAKLPWDKQLGDWSDAQGKAWGREPFSETVVTAEPYGGKVRIDVTGLVNLWKTRNYETNGFYLRGLEGSSVIEFHSLQSGAQDLRPKLVVMTSFNRVTLNPVQDTYLNSTTYKPLGAQNKLQVTTYTPILLNFDFSLLPDGEVVENAYLELSVQKLYRRDKIKVGVFEITPAPHSTKPAEVKLGLAASYSWDDGLNTNPLVYFSSDFESRNWDYGWSDGGKMGKTISSEGNKYEPFSGRSIAATMGKGQNLALNQRFKFVDNGFPEPEQAYFRYYLRLGDNWNQVMSGGKMPGFAGTYNTAGWGSRKPNGTNGWSTRGAFIKTFQQGGDRVTPMGSYVYHLGQGGNYGNTWAWNMGGAALLKNNIWYCIEQFVRLNTPGEADGVLIAWLDGKKVFERKNLQFRTSNILKIEEVWMNIYHGGLDPSPFEQTVYIDNFVVAKDYIGPVNKE